MKTYSTWKKILAFGGVLLSFVIFMISLCTVFLCIDAEIYFTPKKQTLNNVLTDSVIRDTERILNYLDSEEAKQDYCQSSNLEYLSIRGDIFYNDFIYESDEFDQLRKDKHLVAVIINADTSDYEFLDTLSGTYQKISIHAYVNSNPTKVDRYFYYIHGLNFLYVFGYLVFPLMFVSVCIGITLLVFLLKMVGKKDKESPPYIIWETHIPFDLESILFLILFYLFVLMGVDAGYSIISLGAENDFLCIPCFTVSAAVFLFWLVSLTIRIRNKVLWKKTLLRYCFLMCKKSGTTLCEHLPFIWKALLLLGGLSIFEIVVALFCSLASQSILPALLFIPQIILLALIAVYYLIQLNKFRLAAKELAQGNLSYQLTTNSMHGEFKKTGTDLNHIAHGMNIAVEERLKSERMKTELITNVSHDIKTPLTSIINYADLIAKESCENAKINEYSEVLLRQSTKLKRLIEDLVEASKASTGNLEVELTPCNASIFIEQASGEYEEKLQQANLTLITKLPEESHNILADSRRMWRIFDNLLNNICKYALPGTRVYLSLDFENDEAVFLFKNTSRDALDLSPEELLERFVRGDKSRNTEGNGLGLSIANSMAQLQKGTLLLHTDGDLFKVELRFPLC